MIGRGLLVALIALLGAPLMLVAASAELPNLSPSEFAQAAIFGLGPAISAFLLRRRLLRGQVLVRLLFMLLATVLGIYIGLTLGLLVSAFWKGTSIAEFASGMPMIFFMAPIVFFGIFAPAPWAFLVWFLCAGLTLALGDPQPQDHTRAQPPG